MTQGRCPYRVPVLPEPLRVDGADPTCEGPSVQPGCSSPLNDPSSVRVEHSQHRPFLAALMHQGVRIESLSRSGAGHDSTVRPLGFASVWRM